MVSFQKGPLVDVSIYVMESALAASQTPHVCVVFWTMALQSAQVFVLVFSSAMLVEKVIPQRIRINFQNVFIGM
ncbi:hypothetical protein D0X99_10160 [Algoriphagus lacus]|uniref:Uncharacterized protein n=1 Tax=Algoriphagus lacus TaxID=2056311 RepID=A0A418PSE0_9BACT|nr:hypothetical protein D0X99_10160 [Algoriphagus lacus]